MSEHMRTPPVPPQRRRPPAADIEAVARRAGVSTATVSRALRGLPNVSASTRERVLAAAKALNYVVSPSASRLASGRTRSIAVVLPHVGRPYFALILEGVERVLREAGYDVLLYVLPDEGAREAFFDRMPLRRRVDAVLVVTLPLQDGQAEQFSDLGIPVGTVEMELPDVPHVGIDDAAAASQATNHLINLGHRRVAMIGGAADGPPAAVPEKRRAGYRSAMAAAELPVPAHFEVDGEFSAAGGEHAMAQLLAQAIPPTAVFVQSDRMAMGALRALRSAGLTCPEDISIVGFGDHDLAASLDLTTIYQPMADQGAAAAQLLLAALDGETVSDQLLPTSLVLRKSTAPPRDLRQF